MEPQWRPSRLFNAVQDLIWLKSNPDEPEPNKVRVHNFLAQCTRNSLVRALKLVFHDVNNCKATRKSILLLSSKLMKNYKNLFW